MSMLVWWRRCCRLGWASRSYHIVVMVFPSSIPRLMMVMMLWGWDHLYTICCALPACSTARSSIRHWKLLYRISIVRILEHILLTMVLLMLLLLMISAVSRISLIIILTSPIMCCRCRSWARWWLSIRECVYRYWMCHMFINFIRGDRIGARIMMDVRRIHFSCQ